MKHTILFMCLLIFIGFKALAQNVEADQVTIKEYELTDWTKGIRTKEDWYSCFSKFKMLGTINDHIIVEEIVMSHHGHGEYIEKMIAHVFDPNTKERIHSELLYNVPTDDSPKFYLEQVFIFKDRLITRTRFLKKYNKKGGKKDVACEVKAYSLVSGKLRAKTSYIYGTKEIMYSYQQMGQFSYFDLTISNDSNFLYAISDYVIKDIGLDEETHPYSILVFDEDFEVVKTFNLAPRTKYELKESRKEFAVVYQDFAIQIKFNKKGPFKPSTLEARFMDGDEVVIKHFSDAGEFESKTPMRFFLGASIEDNFNNVISLPLIYRTYTKPGASPYVLLKLNIDNFEESSANLIDFKMLSESNESDQLEFQTQYFKDISQIDYKLEKTTSRSELICQNFQGLTTYSVFVYPKLKNDLTTANPLFITNNNEAGEGFIMNRSEMYSPEWMYNANYQAHTGYKEFERYKYTEHAPVILSSDEDRIVLLSNFQVGSEEYRSFAIDFPQMLQLVTIDKNKMTVRRDNIEAADPEDLESPTYRVEPSMAMKIGNKVVCIQTLGRKFGLAEITLGQ